MQGNRAGWSPLRNNECVSFCPGHHPGTFPEHLGLGSELQVAAGSLLFLAPAGTHLGNDCLVHFVLPGPSTLLDS